MTIKSADIKRISYNITNVTGVLKDFPRHQAPQYDIRDNVIVKMIEKLKESNNVLLYGLDKLDEINAKDGGFVKVEDYKEMQEYYKKTRLL